ncbi:MAG: ABC transporter ATP-binding protein [Pseudonocardiales bacterium]|nr:ABC transporter ATP-binding protein [Pseudonocardiales bacterium]
MPSVSEQPAVSDQPAERAEDRREYPAEPAVQAASRTTVSVQDLSITYRTALDRKAQTMRQRVLALGQGRPSNIREVQALRGVSFDVTQGTVMGIVGPNGAGKSTLMRALAGILPPTSGVIEVNGRVSTLLALGVGFNSNLTGRENVLLGGLAAGLTRAEIRERYDEIADFAALEDGFIDMPMRTYSSGMYGRLAFAVAVHMEPDILLVDEALSAGDARFKHKAFAKMGELMAQARTIFLVSHALGSVIDLCNDAIWLQKGQLIARGKPQEIVDAYSDSLNVKQDAISMEDT